MDFLALSEAVPDRLSGERTDSVARLETPSTNQQEIQDLSRGMELAKKGVSLRDEEREMKNARPDAA